MFKTGYACLLYGRRRTPLALKVLECDMGGEAMKMARQLARNYPQAVGYEIWGDGEKIASSYLAAATASDPIPTPEIEQLARFAGV